MRTVRPGIAAGKPPPPFLPPQPPPLLHTTPQNSKLTPTPSLFLLLAGIFTKFAASLVAIPSAVLGGMTTFLFTAVAVSGLAIVAKGVPFTRRNRFVLTAGLALGYGATLVPDYFEHVFAGVAEDDKALRGFLDAIALVMETGFAVTALVTVVLNLVLPVEMEEAEEVGVVGEGGSVVGGGGGVGRGRFVDEVVTEDKGSASGHDSGEFKEGKSA